MVRLIHKKTILTLAAIIAVVAVPVGSNLNGALATTCLGSTLTDKQSCLQVNVAEVLTISVSEPTTWAAGDVNTLLRNKLNISVVSNNGNGYTASMYTKTNTTDLVNTDTSITSNNTIPTLTSSTTAGSFDPNFWGYSLDDNATGKSDANYNGVRTSANPITLLTKGDGNDNTRDVYFGAKADSTKVSGTYAQTMVFAVVSGVIDNSTNPTVPTDPTGPQSDPTNPSTNPVVAYDNSGSNNRTVYTNRSTSSGISTTESTVTNGDNRSSYAGATEVSYQAPQGVTRSTSGNNSLAIGLAVASGVATVSGIGIFVLAKRRKDDDDEEQ